MEEMDYDQKYMKTLGDSGIIAAIVILVIAAFAGWPEAEKALVIAPAPIWDGKQQPDRGNSQSGFGGKR